MHAERWKTKAMTQKTEAAVRRYSSKQVFLKISQYSQENNEKKETPIQVFSCEFYEIFKNTFFLIEHLHRTPSVAAFKEINSIPAFFKATLQCLSKTFIT